MPNQVGAGTPDIGIPKRTDAREWQVAPGGYNLPGLGALEGSPDEWANGTLHSKWLTGGYGPMQDCVNATIGLVLADLDGVRVGGGKGMGATVSLADTDGLAVAFSAPTSGAVVLSDLDGLAVVSQPGATESVSLSDVDGLAVGVATGGEPPSSLSDLDGLVVEPGTGGEPESEVSDVDGMSIDGEASEPSGPGATCGTAGPAPLGDTQEATINPGEHHWWTFPVSNGTTYHCTYERISGDSTNGAELLHGTCPTPTFAGGLTLTGCASFVAGSGEAGFVHVLGGTIGSTTYQITPNTGSCP